MNVREPGSNEPIEINPGDHASFVIEGEVVRLEEGTVGDVTVIVRDERGHEIQVPYRVQRDARIEVQPAIGTGRGSDIFFNTENDPLFGRFLDKARADAAANPHPVVTVEHPLADQVFRAFGLWQRIAEGDWGAIIDIFPEKVLDADTAREALRRLGRDLGATGAKTDSDVKLTDAGEGFFTVTGPISEIRSALDLYHRVQMGQWSVVVWACPPAGHFDHDIVNDVRVRHQVPGVWPEHIRAYIGIAQAPESARAAYHVHQMLYEGGRTPTFSLTDGPVHVTVNGVDVTYGRVPVTNGRSD